jgi:UDP-glucose 4-epimerase
MNVLVTGGAGFIGRWVVKQLLDDNHQVWVIDNLSNGCKENLQEFSSHPGLIDVRISDIKNVHKLSSLFNQKFDVCYHLAASINVQDSIDDPQITFENDVTGTFHILEQCRQSHTKIVFLSTCMVYDCAAHRNGIRESNLVKPRSPYAGAKIAAENLVLSYYYAYGLPVAVLRPFNTYGPYQKSGGEGGVVAIFIRKKLNGEKLLIYGDGNQTRDLLYVEDCARFIVNAGYSNAINGEIINAGTGRDISINDLAKLVTGRESQIQHVAHIHPQSEIAKLKCDYRKSKHLLGWEPTVSLKDGIERTEVWIRSTIEQ